MSLNSLTEAFKRMRALNEDTLNATDDDVEKLAELENEDDAEDGQINIIDPEAETEAELKTDYVGKVILECPVCHSFMFKAKGDIEIDNESEKANVSEECPYCCTTGGFLVCGIVSAYSEEEEEVEEQPEENEDELTPEAETPVEDVAEEESAVEAEDAEEVAEESDVEDEEEVTEGLLGNAIGAGVNAVKNLLTDKLQTVENDLQAQIIAALNDALGSDGWTTFEYDDEDVKESEDEDDMGEFFGEVKVFNGDEVVGVFTIDDDNKLVKVEEKTEEESEEKDEEESEKVDEACERCNEKMNDNPLADLDDNTLEFPNGEYFYVEYENGNIYAGGATNTGVFHEFELPYDFDASVDANLQALGELMIEQRPELMDELKTEACNREAIKEAEEPEAKAELVKGGFANLVDAAKNEKYCKDCNEDVNVSKTDNGETIVSTDDADITIRDKKQEEEIPAPEEVVPEETETVADEAPADEEVPAEEEAPVEEEPTVQPLNDEEKEQIKSGEAKEEEQAEEDAEKPAEEKNEEEEEEMVDADVNEIAEEAFDRLGEKYLKNTYENVESYKTTSATSVGNTLKLEGIITFKSGKTKPTSFVFEAKDMTATGKARFVGMNESISSAKRAFTVSGKLKDGMFLSESLNYNYSTKDTTGKPTRVYGTVSNKK